MTTFRYYQAPQPSRSDAASDSEGSDSPSRNDHGSYGNSNSKRSGACTHCKSLKVRCNFTPGQDACQRCKLGNFKCVGYTRKKRRAVPTHEELQEKSHRQDVEIRALLEQIDSTVLNRRIEGWLSKSNSDSPFASSQSSEVGTRQLTPEGQCNRLLYPHTVFQTPSAYVERMERTISVEHLLAYFPDDENRRDRSAPDILTTGFITPHEVHDLFNIYFQFIHPSFSVLDPESHTPGRLIWRSGFLFTVICALASRFYNSRRNLYSSAIEFAHDAAGKALVQTCKSVEVCQAYLLLAVYPVPKKKWIDDRSWLFMGLASSMANELNLSDPTPGAYDEREQLNRIRTWLMCFCVDSSHATQFGKVPLLSMNDYVARHSREWYQSSRFNLETDVHLVALVDLVRVMGQFKKESDAITENKIGESKPRFLCVTEKYHAELLRLWQEWSAKFAKRPRSNSHMCAYRADTVNLVNAYSRLVVLSYGFQTAAKEGLLGRVDVAAKAIETAQEVILIMTRRLYPTGMLRYSVEAHFLFASFAASFLLILLTPKFRFLLKPGQAVRIEEFVRELVDNLRSREVALDSRHPPFLYARFLGAALKKFGSNAAPEAGPSSNSVHSRATRPCLEPGYPTRSLGVQGSVPQKMDRQFEGLYQGGGQAMDFSIQNFMQTISAQPNLMDVSPPPGEDPQVWWTEGFQDNNFSLSEEFRWPMVVDARYSQGSARGRLPDMSRG